MSHTPLARIIAHRGASGYSPENTLSAIQLAADQGASCVEIDVSISIDNVPFVHHDDKLDRCTSGSGLLCEHSAEQLDKLSAGMGMAGFEREPLPRLTDVIELLVSNRLGLNLEIKPYPRLEQRTVEAICSALALWPQNLPLVLSSFNHSCLDIARELFPTIARAPLVGSIPDNWQTLMYEHEAQNLHCSASSFNEAKATQVLREGFGLYCYTVNDVETAEHLLACGVHGIFTDFPDIMHSRLTMLA